MTVGAWEALGTEVAPVETVTPIKPSEALRLGRLVRPEQVRVRVFKGTYAACAIGAMAVGLGFDPDGETNEGDDVEDAALKFVGEQFDWNHDCHEVPQDGTLQAVWHRFDRAPDGTGDAAVLAYLAERGL